MRVLHVVPSFYPAVHYGGSTASTYGLCNALAASRQVELRVLTTDAAGPRRSDRIRIKPDSTHYCGYNVRFMQRVAGDSVSPSLAGALWPAMRWADIVHLTGVYSFPTLPTLAVARLLNKPVVWSPRGALLASTRWTNGHHVTLKRTWEIVCRALLPRQTLLHATSELERAGTSARMPGIEIVVVPNGVALPVMKGIRQWQPGGALRVMFIGRLHPIKRIDMLIDAIAFLRSVKVRLDIYGQGEPAYERALVQSIAHHRLDDRVRLHGHVDGEEKRGAFENADVVVLPSYSENFGMVIAEALAHGVPVIASRGTPWPELERRRCGLSVDDGAKPLAKAIQAMCSYDLAAMGQRGRDWMSAEFDWMGVAAHTVDAYQRLVLTARNRCGSSVPRREEQ